MVEHLAPDPKDNAPRHLYKYRSLAAAQKSHVRDLIIDQKLYFSKPAALNDPFEFSPVLETVASASEQHRHLKEIANRVNIGKPRHERRGIANRLIAQDSIRKHEQAFRSTMSQVGVFSMTPRHLDLLMWPHYADNHRGICLRFDLQTLCQLGLVPMPVQYSQQRPVYDFVRDNPQEMMTKSALTKGLPWGYEHEWRLVQSGKGGHVERVASQIMTAVILGARISSEDERDVLAWISDSPHTLEVFQAGFHAKDYALETHAVNC